MNRRVLAFSTMLAAVLLPGCSIFNPHLMPRYHPEMDPREPASRVCVAGTPSEPEKAVCFLPLFCPKKKARYDLPTSINYANHVRRQYETAVGTLSKLRNGVAVGTVAMSAAALGLGVTGGPTEAITALGVGAASAFGIGTQLYSDARQRVYNAGSQAIGCAIQAMTPFIISTVEMCAFDDALKVLNRGVSNLSARIAEVEARVSAAPGDPAVPAARSEVAAAKALREQASDALQKGALLRHQVDTAGVTLTTVVDNIRAKVSDQVTKTEPDLQSVAAMISGLGTSVSRFTPTPPAATKPPPGPPPGALVAPSDLMQAVEDLREAEQAVRDHIPEVTGLVIRVAAASATAGSITSCSVGEVDIGFRISPDVQSLELKAGQSYQFTVSGSPATPRAAFAGATVPEVTVDVSTSNGTSVVVITTKSTLASEFNSKLVIVDGTGKQQKVIDLTIKP